MRKVLNMQLFAMAVVALALMPCAFEAEPSSLGGGGELQRVQEPDAGEEVAQKAEASETSAVEEPDTAGGIADESQDSGAITDPPQESK